MRRRAEGPRLCRAVFAVVQEDFRKTICVIRDTGHDCGEPSVTNDAENVVLELVATGRVTVATRLLYYDSEGDLSALLHDGRRFLGFGPATKCPTPGCYGAGPDVADQGPDPERGIPIPCASCGMLR